MYENFKKIFRGEVVPRDLVMTVSKATYMEA